MFYQLSYSRSFDYVARGYQTVISTDNLQPESDAFWLRAAHLLAYHPKSSRSVQTK
jgi:hypothetical protein